MEGPKLVTREGQSYIEWQEGTFTALSLGPYNDTRAQKVLAEVLEASTC